MTAVSRSNFLPFILLSLWIPNTFGRLADVLKVSIRPANEPVGEVGLHMIHGRNVHGHPKITTVGRHGIGTGPIKAEYETFDEFINRQSKLKQPNDVLAHKKEEDVPKTNGPDDLENSPEPVKKSRHQRVAPNYPKKFLPYRGFFDSKNNLPKVEQVHHKRILKFVLNMRMYSIQQES